MLNYVVVDITNGNKFEIKFDSLKMAQRHVEGILKTMTVNRIMRTEFYGIIVTGNDLKDLYKIENKRYKMYEYIVKGILTIDGFNLKY